MNDSAVQALNYLEDDTAEAIKVDERDRGLQQSLITYLRAVRTLTSGNHTEEEMAAAHETLDGFKEFPGSAPVFLYYAIFLRNPLTLH